MLPTLYFTEIKPKLFNELLSAFDEIDIRLIADHQHAEGLDQPAWYLIDWLTKDRAGLEICRDLRAAKMPQSVYITMVLDPFDNDDDTKRRAIKAGADGYLAGPLTIEKMLTRLTMLSTTERSAQDCDVVRLSNLEIDIRSREEHKSDLETATAYKKRAIGMAIQKLEADGWINVRRTRGKGNRYFINSPATRALLRTEQNAIAAPRSASDALNPSNIQKKKNDGELGNAVDKCADSAMLLPAGVSAKQWSAYTEVRAQKGAPNTDYVLDELLSKLHYLDSRGGDASGPRDHNIVRR